MNRPLHIFFLSSTSVPNEFAHPIQILKTIHALGSCPDVRVSVYFVSLAASEREIWRSCGLEPPPHARIRGMAPRWLFRLAGMNNYINPEKYPIYRRIGRRLGRAIARSARQGPTLVYTRNENAMSLVAGAAHEAGVPVYLELHWLKALDRIRKRMARRGAMGTKPGLGEWKKRARRETARERECLRQADGILCLTKSIGRILEKWDVGRPAIWLPSAADLPDDATRARAVEDIDVLYVGQMYPWKGVDGLIDAMADLAGRGLTLVGGSDSRDATRLRTLAERRGITDRIQFIGQLGHPDVAGYIRRAKVCAVPLPRRGFPEARFFTSPLKVFEFAALGKAIVASDLPSLRDSLIHGKNAWLVEPDNPGALAKGIRILLEDDKLRARLGAGAAELAASHTYERRARRILDFCRVPSPQA